MVKWLGIAAATVAVVMVIVTVVGFFGSEASLDEAWYEDDKVWNASTLAMLDDILKNLESVKDTIVALLHDLFWDLIQEIVHGNPS